MARYVTVAEVRAVCGITTKFISDADFGQLINSTEYSIERMANTCFTPKTIIEQHNGDGTERLILDHNPVLKVRALKIDDTDITPEYIRINKQGGVLWLTTSAETSYFKGKATERNLVRVKYDFGLLTSTAITTTLTTATTAGSTVTVPVTDSSSLTADDYIEIEGMDSQREVCQISSVTDETNIVVDNLALPHESDSLVTKQDVPPVAQRLMQIGCAMAGVARVVGQSFDEITGYTLGDESVQKGEPYTQWREVTTQLRKEWDDLWRSFRTRPSVM